ncbi:MAG TPA: hypothetical protein VFK27_06215 [Bacillales bacterium]|jgi:hypothetical protein|nr:hypothetical protein [Bacillales bacterium]
MIDLLFNLSSDPFFYIVTLTLLANLSGVSVWVFLNKHFDPSFVLRSNPADGSFRGPSSGVDPEWIAGLLTMRIAAFIRRKESPQDDTDDHPGLNVAH